MSDNERPDNAAVRELDVLVRHLADELANFRRRALTAEARIKELESHEGGAVGFELFDPRLGHESSTPKVGKLVGQMPHEHIELSDGSVLSLFVVGH